ncbi:hypothetical protein Rhe02_18200 [Rhizocola hellebori]|uniref:Uncharacterized protein n=1 Tax=Rhizocola hellebori TaxID=1392758 RepID=A0A8J3Q4F9_9ACTN|nr:hypothetical protein [Rhizocola hellebori]GIH03753.1 hypothetical protein Rhe02_18200 [Rhizocola hellebori]
MRTLLGIFAGVLGLAVAVASVTNVQTGSTPAYARPPLTGAGGVQDLELRGGPHRAHYGVMEGQLFLGIANPPPTPSPPPSDPPLPWTVIGAPDTGNSAGYFNAVRRDGAGRATVWLPGLDPEVIGAVLVTAAGPAAGFCKAAQMGPSPTEHPGVDVHVACFDPAGNPLSTGFSLTYTRPAARIVGSGGWVRAGDQFNSAGGQNTTTRVASGSYLVRMPGLGGPGGHAQVSATGSSSNWCKVSRWYAAGVDELVAVRCFTPGGTPADSTFNLVFARDTDAALTSNRAAAFYVSSADPDAAFVTSTRTGGGVTIERLAPGRYHVRAPLDLTGGVAHAAALGEGTERCRVLGWNNTDGVQVTCSADTAFTVAWSS